MVFPHPVLAGFNVVINKVRAGLGSWVSYCRALQRLPAKPRTSAQPLHNRDQMTLELRKR